MYICTAGLVNHPFSRKAASTDCLRKPGKQAGFALAQVGGRQAEVQVQTYKRYQNAGRIWQVKVALEQRPFEHSTGRGLEMLGRWCTCWCYTCWCLCSLPAVVCQMLCGRTVLLALVGLFPWSCACSLPAVVCQMLCGRTVLQALVGAVRLELRVFTSSCRLPNAVWEDCAASSCGGCSLGAARVPLQLSFAKCSVGGLCCWLL